MKKKKKKKKNQVGVGMCACVYTYICAWELCAYVPSLPHLSLTLATPRHSLIPSHQHLILTNLLSFTWSLLCNSYFQLCLPYYYVNHLYLSLQYLFIPIVTFFPSYFLYFYFILSISTFFFLLLLRECVSISYIFSLFPFSFHPISSIFFFISI